LPVVLYGYERSLTLREEHRLKVFENRVLRRIFGPERDEVTARRRKLLNEELHGLYSSSNIVQTIKSRSMRWVGYVVRMGDTINACKILTGKREGKIPTEDLGVDWRIMSKWILGCEGDVLQDRNQWLAVVSTVMNLRVP
jgi:hypothetical protein